MLASRWGTVSSVTRTRENNLAVGGAANSYHLIGRAIDVARRPGVRHRDVEAALLSAGYALLESLDEGDHSHFALANGAGQKFDVAKRQVAPSEPHCEKEQRSLGRPAFAHAPELGDCRTGGGSKPKKHQARLAADEAPGKLLVDSGTIRVDTAKLATRK
jgi:hypothetical protein